MTLLAKDENPAVIKFLTNEGNKPDQIEQRLNGDLW